MGFCMGTIVGIINILMNASMFEGYSVGTIFFVCLWFIVLYGLIGGVIEYVWKIIKYLIKGN